MTNFIESPSWEDKIGIIERGERVSGGQDGVANRPLKALANRTQFLKERQENTLAEMEGKVTAVYTFTEGATLESPRDEILYDNYRLVWTGDFPKEVPPGSTPLTSGGIGAGKWAYTSDAAIRKELLKYDGFKNFGRCPSVEELRKVEPSYAGQAIMLERLAPGAPTVNAILNYDPDDTTSPDDGLSVFVTAGGARWKTDISQGMTSALLASILTALAFPAPIKKFATLLLLKSWPLAGSITSCVSFVWCR